MTGCHVPKSRPLIDPYPDPRVIQLTSSSNIYVRPVLVPVPSMPKSSTWSLSFRISRSALLLREEAPGFKDSVELICHFTWCQIPEYRNINVALCPYPLFYMKERRSFLSMRQKRGIMVEGKKIIRLDKLSFTSKSEKWMLRILANILLETVTSSFYQVFRLEYMLMEVHVVRMFNHRVPWIETQ
jgi:hypothetical protein